MLALANSGNWWISGTGNAVASAEYYNATSDMWTLLPAAVPALYYMYGCTVNNVLILAGGFTPPPANVQQSQIVALTPSSLLTASPFATVGNLPAADGTIACMTIS